MTIRRTGVTLAGIACVLLVVTMFLTPMLLNADRYRPQVISYLEEMTGKKVEIGQLAVKFLPRIEIQVDNFDVKSPPLFPPSYIVKVARIDAQLDARALLHRQVVIRSLLLEEPIINLVSDPDGPWNFENPAAQSTGNDLPSGGGLTSRGQTGACDCVQSPAFRRGGSGLFRGPQHIQRA